MATKNSAPKKVAKEAIKQAAKPNKPTKLFVLDTNVFLHDPHSIYRFADNDVFLPIMTLEELDNNKKGLTEIARNARQTARTLDEILIKDAANLKTGISLKDHSHKIASGKLFLQTEYIASTLPEGLPTAKADNQILAVVLHLSKKHPDKQVILVSKDINMRIKACALGIAAEDYFHDQVVEDTELLYSGMFALPANFWAKHSEGLESWTQNGITHYRVKGALCATFYVNQLVYLEGEKPFYALVKSVDALTKQAHLETLVDYSHAKNNVWGITARNLGQNFALNLLMNPDIDFVSLLGQAGTGKTLLAIAASLTQVLESKRYSEIIMTRATVPVGEEIGFLPGSEEEKMSPWMGALEDNLEVLSKGEAMKGDFNKAATNDLLKSKIKIKSLSFMRGRTFLNKLVIIDEAQNLTPKQMKTLITRAGPETKIICLGNIAQIDTPYLTEGSSGLTYVVERFKNWAYSGHVTLSGIERSRLAEHAALIL